MFEVFIVGSSDSATTLDAIAPSWRLKQQYSCAEALRAIRSSSSVLTSDIDAIIFLEPELSDVHLIGQILSSAALGRRPPSVHFLANEKIRAAIRRLREEGGIPGVIYARAVEYGVSDINALRDDLLASYLRETVSNATAQLFPIRKEDGRFLGRSATYDLWLLKGSVNAAWPYLDKSMQRTLLSTFRQEHPSEPPRVDFFQVPRAEVEGRRRSSIWQLCNTEEPGDGKFQINRKENFEIPYPSVVSDSVLKAYKKALWQFYEETMRMGVRWPFAEEVRVFITGSAVLGLGEHWAMSDIDPTGNRPFVLLPAFDSRPRTDIPVNLDALVWKELTYLLLRGHQPLPSERLAEWLWYMESVALMMAHRSRNGEHATTHKLNSQLAPLTLDHGCSEDERILFLESLSQTDVDLVFRLLEQRQIGDHWLETLMRSSVSAADVCLYFTHGTRRTIGSIMPTDRVSDRFHRRAEQLSIEREDATGVIFEKWIDNLSCVHFDILVERGINGLDVRVRCDDKLMPRLTYEFDAADESSLDLVEEETPMKTAPSQKVSVDYNCDRRDGCWDFVRIKMSDCSRTVRLAIFNTACRGVSGQYFTVECTGVSAASS